MPNIDTRDLDATAGAVYFTVGRGTEGGSASFRLSVAGVDKSEWGQPGAVAENSGYSIGTIQVDLGQRGTWALGATSGRALRAGETTYVDGIIDQAADFARRNGLTFPQDTTQLRADLLSHGNGKDGRSTINFIDPAVRDSINAWANSDEGKRWIHAKIDYPQVRNATQTAMTILDRSGSHIPEDRRFEAINILAKTANQYPGRLDALEKVLKDGGDYDALMTKAKSYSGAYAGDKAGLVAEAYENSYNADPNKRAAMDRAHAAVVRPDYDPSKERNNPDVQQALGVIGAKTPRNGGPSADPMADGVLERGEKGPAVKAMQEQLIKAGITQVNGKPFTADSDFGQQTEAAVREYQRTRGLKVDGEAGPDTLKALKENAPAKTQPSPEPASPTQGNGNSNWPAPGNFKINDADKPGEGHGEFGTSRGGGTRTHKGVDIEGKVGDPIESFRPGTVIAVKPNNGAAGNMVTIDHGNGLTSTYMHLDKIHAKVGQKVPEDIEVIGTMGRTGNTPKAGDTHLHFEIRKNGEAVDPMPYLKGAKDLDSPAASKTELHHGDKGAQVEGLQKRLNELGYTDASGKQLKPDSDFGDRTKQAVEQFQRENGMKVTGVADQETMRLVEKGMTRHAAADGELKPGEKGPDVRGFQTTLNELGYKGADGKPLKVDGDYGGNTQAAVSAFQKANGLPETGVADKATLEKVGQQSKLEPKVDADARITGVAPQDAPRAPAARTTDQPANQPPTGHDHAPDRTPREPAAPAPQINQAGHPDNKLYTQAVSNLEQLGPNGGFKSRDEMERAAGALAADAKSSGLTQIDHVTRSKNGEGLIAVQGNDPWAPDAKRAFLDVNQAASQTIDQSTRMADAKRPDQAVAPQQNPQRIDGIDSPVQKDETQTKPKSVMV